MKKIAIIAATLAFPVISFAQSLTRIQTLVGTIGIIVNTVIPIVFAIALLVFFWGLVRYLFASEHDRETAKKTMLWGIVALFVMASVWGLVNFIGENLGVGRDSAPSVSPLIPKS